MAVGCRTAPPILHVRVIILATALSATIARQLATPRTKRVARLVRAEIVVQYPIRHTMLNRATTEKIECALKYLLTCPHYADYYLVIGKGIGPGQIKGLPR